MHRNKIEMTGALVNMIASVFLKYLFIDNWSAFRWSLSSCGPNSEGSCSTRSERKNTSRNSQNRNETTVIIVQPFCF